MESIDEEVESIEVIKEKLKVKEPKKETKVIKFVSHEEIKSMDFSKDIEGIANLFSAM